MTFFFYDCKWYIGGRGHQNVTTEFPDYAPNLELLGANKDRPRTATGMDGTLTLIFAISETLRYIKMF